MQFESHSERLAWRNNPGDGIAVVGSNNQTHMVVAINPTAAELERLTRHGAELYAVPEREAAKIDGKDWYSDDDDAEVTPLPESARRIYRV